MKKVAVFYRDRDNQTAINHIENSLKSVLGDYVSIDGYYLNEMDVTQSVEADAYLVLYEEMLCSLVGHISDYSKVVVITRSIQRKYLLPILEIEKSSQVLVVNDSKESILQTMYMIYELGVGHLKLLPYDQELLNSGAYDNVNSAIVANGSEALIPKHISRIYNIRNRQVSFETFQKLISILKLENPVVQSNLINKINDDLDTGINFRNSYFSNFLKDQMITNVIENSSRAIVLVDKNNVVNYINETAYKVFEKRTGDSFTPVTEEVLKPLDADNYKDQLLPINEENYLVEKQSFELLDNIIGHLYVFQNEKELRDTEVNLNKQLKSRGLYAKYNFKDIIHQSTSMEHCIQIAKKVAPSDYTILIRGESGTGKELMAQSIHNYSLRKNFPFVAVNCAALPETLLESELFGYEAGAFTGAQKNGKIGLFEHANHGTIFLDEIGDISPNLQSRLLRAIQERQIMRVGSDKIINIDVRVLAATNADLEQQIVDGKFRSDLYYRLNVIALNIAPLRERADDIFPLLRVFLGQTMDNITPKESKILINYSWPGNVRELENVASYYRLLGVIPEYLSSGGNHLLTQAASSSGSTPSITDYDDHTIKLAVLNVIDNHSDSFHGIGRTSLHVTLASQRVNIGEGKLRRVLSELQSEGLIKVNIGRSGSQITDKGKEYILEQSLDDCHMF